MSWKPANPPPPLRSFWTSEARIVLIDTGGPDGPVAAVAAYFERENPDAGWLAYGWRGTSPDGKPWEVSCDQVVLQHDMPPLPGQGEPEPVDEMRELIEATFAENDRRYNPFGPAPRRLQ